MSTYTVSDLHGYPVEKFKTMLNKVGFTDEDTLFVLGDVIDRNGDGGIGLLRYFMTQPNIELIIGNHEEMLLACGFLFNEISDDALPFSNIGNAMAYFNYLSNGGRVTIESLRELSKNEPGVVGGILDYLRDAPHIGALTVGSRDFLLVHSGLGGFDPCKKISEYKPEDLLWTRPELDTEYFDDIITVFGHTPTLYYGDEYRGKVLKTRTWIDIDVGAGQAFSPALLRLDDLEVFYGE